MFVTGSGGLSDQVSGEDVANSTQTRGLVGQNPHMPAFIRQLRLRQRAGRVCALSHRAFFAKYRAAHRWA